MRPSNSSATSNRVYNKMLPKPIVVPEATSIHNIRGCSSIRINRVNGAKSGT